MENKQIKIEELDNVVGGKMITTSVPTHSDYDYAIGASVNLKGHNGCKVYKHGYYYNGTNYQLYYYVKDAIGAFANWVKITTGTQSFTVATSTITEIKLTE